MDYISASELIEELCTEQDIDRLEDILKEHFTDVKFVDEKIDDGLDDGDYLKMRSYNADDFYVRFFYPDSTGIVSSIEVRDR